MLSLADHYQLKITVKSNLLKILTNDKTKIK